MHSVGYRADIDGLRAIAVLAVVFFHVGVSFTPGGFVGVDVFFVISGYLITQILMRELSDGHFSIWQFYERRIRRILPALLAVVGSSALLAWLFLTPRDLQDFGQSVVAVSTFSSNIFFWLKADYFSPAAELRPLLHTWSLAVEEQFYIGFPIVLYVVYRHKPRHLVAVLAAVGAASLAFSQWQVTRYPEAAFYLLPARAWELALGALLAAGAFPRVQSDNAREALSVLGLLLIGTGVAFYTKATTFPGVAALLPCVGAALLIHVGSGERRPIVNRLLSWRPVVFIGLLSYSLYLWHWPVIAFLRYIHPVPLTTVQVAGVLILSGVLAVLSWRFVEQPFRKAKIIPTQRAVIAFGGASLTAVLAGGLVLHFLNGVPSRLPPELRYESLVNQDREQCFVSSARLGTAELCRIGVGSDRIDFMLWGDSHAEAIRGGFDTAAIQAGLSGVFVGTSGCAPLVGLRRYDRSDLENELCAQTNELALRLMREKRISAVFLLGRWPVYAEGTGYGYEEEGLAVLLQQGAKGGNSAIFANYLRNTVREVSAIADRVYLISSIPEVGFDVPRAIARTQMLGIPTPKGPNLQQYLERNYKVAGTLEMVSHMSNIEILEPARWLCNTGDCMIVDAGHPLYQDDDHLSLYGAHNLAGMLKPAMVAIKESLKNSPDGG